MRNSLACLLPLAVLLLASCKTYHYMYAPVAAPTPMFNKKGESNVTALYTFGSLFRTRNETRNDGYDLQGAYAITDHLAITASFAHRRERNVYDSTNASSTTHTNLLYHRNTTSFGMGYFTPCDTRGTAFFDLYGGYAIGRNQLEDFEGATSTSYTHFHNANTNNYYLQPGFHFNTGGNFQIALATRINTVSWFNITTDYSAAQEHSYHIDNLHSTVFTFLEPSFTLRGGPANAPWLRFELQCFTSIKLNQSALYYRESYMSLGVSFDCSKINDHGGRKAKGFTPPPR